MSKLAALERHAAELAHCCIVLFEMFYLQWHWLFSALLAKRRQTPSCKVTSVNHGSLVPLCILLAGKKKKKHFNVQVWANTQCLFHFSTAKQQ